MKPLAWKTITGAIVWAVGIAAAPEHAGLLGPVWSGVAQGLGVILTALGLRHAIAKGPGQ